MFQATVRTPIHTLAVLTTVPVPFTVKKRMTLILDENIDPGDAGNREHSARARKTEKITPLVLKKIELKH